MNAVRILPLLVLVASAGSPPLWVGHFAEAGTPPAPWRTLRVPGKTATAYRVATVAGRIALEAKFKSSMSLMVRPITVDLRERPIMCWRWYVDGPVQWADMSRKSGDDYAARIYVGFDMPDSALSAMERLKLNVARNLYGKSLPDAAVVYVWDNVHARGTARKSSYTNRMQLVVSEAGASQARTWVSERANVAADFAKAFGNKPGKPVQIAVASDGDNTRSSGRAAFADIHFVGADSQCAL